MKIIRALWGGNRIGEIRNEIPLKPQHDEVVYVWGTENLEYLISLGYDTRYMVDSKTTEYSYESEYALKLEALDLAYQEFKEFLFLDWDCINTKSIYGLEFNSPSMPLYSYPKDYIHPNTNLQKQLALYSWEFEDTYVIPNASCISVQGFNLGKELKSIHAEHNFNTLVEEFAFKVFTNCTLDEYIQNYDSPYLYGRESSQYFLVGGNKVNTAKKLNKYIGKKNIRFIHE